MDDVIKKTTIDQYIKNISDNHRKIIDNWCQAYLAELYQCGVDINPGCFTLVEQQDLELDNGKLGKKYWFEPKDQKETSNERMVKILMIELTKMKEYIEDQINILSQEKFEDQFQAKLILNQLKHMVNFLDG